MSVRACGVVACVSDFFQIRFQYNLAPRLSEKVSKFVPFRAKLNNPVARLDNLDLSMRHLTQTNDPGRGHRSGIVVGQLPVIAHHGVISLNLLFILICWE